MLFNSTAFAVFFLIVFALYWSLPHKFRWILLLAASYWFYMSWNPKYVVLILFTTLVSYCTGLILERQSSKKNRKWTLALSTVTSLGVLFFFKYFNFASEALAGLLGLLTIRTVPCTLDLLLPVGISFYTFQTLSYVIDVYRGHVQAERHFGIYAAFISFFPQLVAGPIERTGNLLPQINSVKTFDPSSAAYGLKLMAWGFFKKLVIADTISAHVAPVFHNPHTFQGFSLVLAVVLFTFQIYCDFSGYSDIAIGVAKLMGIELMTNFQSPYFSQSIREFWSRWHISLSTWFRDYLYIPLGGNRVSRPRNIFNLMTTFLVSGLWHGASWTFVVWGGLHGFVQIAERLLHTGRTCRIGSPRWFLRVGLILCFCTLAWVFFAAQTFDDALYILSHMSEGITQGLVSYLHAGFTAIDLGRADTFFLLLSILLLLVFDYLSLQRDVIAALSEKSSLLRWSIYVLFVIWIILNLPAVETTEFIYFQF